MRGISLRVQRTEMAAQKSGFSRKNKRMLNVDVAEIQTSCCIHTKNLSF